MAGDKTMIADNKGTKARPLTIVEISQEKHSFRVNYKHYGSI